MKNFIPENIEYLIKLENTNKNDFGYKFDLKTGIISQYVRRISIPKLETIQKICLHYEITIDAFVNTDLSLAKPYAIKQGEVLYTNVPNDPYPVSPRYVALLESTILDKNKIITQLETQLDQAKSRTTA